MADPRSHRRAKEIFLAVADLDAAERELRIAAECEGDAELRRAVERMLAHDDAPLAPPVGDGAPPERIGPYRVVRLLGQGGAGSVYEVESGEPPSRAALKVLHPWFAALAEPGGSQEADAPDLPRRFLREARLLARLDHPGIARMLDSGVIDEAGAARPYLAMELVRGRPITEHAAWAGLDVRARLALLASVCDAIDHAHQRGVVHRDLKPANVLVDDFGRPRVVDFGIARAVAGGIDVTTIATRSHAILGTVRYMSPEQAAGRSSAVDARSDVYSLGVLAFELLTRSLPLDLDTTSLVDALRRIADSDPALAGDRDPALRGDVETILGKMLEKDPARRYASAAAVAADVRRHLEAQPIVARPPGAAQQIVRLARRHRVLAAGAAAAFVSLAAGLAASLHFAWRATERSEIAERLSYRSSVLLAAHDRDDGNMVECRRHLDAAPESLRNFEWSWLDGLFDTTLAAAPGPPDVEPAINGILAVAALAAPGCGDTVLVARGDGSLDSWSTGTDAATPVAPAFPGRVVGLPVAGTFVAWEDQDGAIRVVRREDAVEVAHVAGPGKAMAADYAPATHRLAARFGTRVVLWDAATGARLAEHPIARFSHDSLCFDHAGARLAFTAGSDGNVVIDALTGTATGTFRNEHFSRAIAFSPDGSLIASTSEAANASQNNAIVVRDGATLEVRRTLRGRLGIVTDLAFAPDGRSIASAANDGAVRLWSVATGEAIVVGRARSVIETVCFVHGGRAIAAGTRSGSVHLLPIVEPAEANVLRGHEEFVYPVAFQPGGALLASGSWDDTVRIWDVASGAQAAVLLGHEHYVHSLAFSPDGARLVSTSADRTCRVWDVKEAREVGRVEPDKRPDALAVDWSHDGAWIALATAAPRAAVWLADGRTLAVVRRIDASESSAGAVAFDRDSRTVVCGDDKGVVRRFAVPEGTPIGTHATDAGAIRAFAWSCAGDRIAVAGGRGSVEVLDAATLERILTLPGQGGEAFGVAYSPDDSRIASAGRDGVLRLWDAASGEPVAEMRGHSDYVWSVAFSPDGRRIATGSGDRTVRLWETDPEASRRRGLRLWNP